MSKIIKHQHTLVGKNHLITKKNSKREKETIKKANKTKQQTSKKKDSSKLLPTNDYTKRKQTKFSEWLSGM